MQLKDRVMCKHMVTHAKYALAFIEGQNEDQFLSSSARFAVTHVMQIMGEAARNVSETGRAEHPEIPWRKITGFRHRAVHGYAEIDFEQVWRIATTEIEPLIKLLEPLILPTD